MKMSNDTLNFMLHGCTKFFAVVCLAVACLVGCSVTKYVPVESQTVTHYIDSVKYNVRDSVVIIPREVYHTYGDLLDTLKMNTKYAYAEAFIDTTHNILNGHLESKATLEYREKIVYKDKIQYRDSIQIKEVPVTVTETRFKTPKWAWGTLIYSLLLTLAIGLKIYLKIKK